MPAESAVAALATKILASLVGPAAKFAWKKLRGDRPLRNLIAKTCSEAMAAALLTCAQEQSIGDEEINHLASLIGDGMEKGLLVDFVKGSLEERSEKSRTEAQEIFRDAVVANLEETSWVDLATTSIPVPQVLDEFTRLLPKYISREAAKPDSLLFNPQVVTSLDDLASSVHEVKESLQELLDRSARMAAVEPHDSLLKAARLIKSSNAEEVVIGVDLVKKVYSNSTEGAELIVPFVCAFLRGEWAPKKGESDPLQDYERALRELSLIELLRTFLSEGPVKERPPDVDLTGARLSWLDLSNVHLGRLTLKETRISGNLKLRNVVTCDHALMQGCIVDGVADFQNARFTRGLSCEHAAFTTLDFSNVHLGEACSFENAEFLGATGFSDRDFSVEASSAVFEKGASFDKAWIGEGVDLRSLTSKESTSFIGASFCGSADFTDSHFMNGLDLSDCSVVDLLKLEGIHLYGDLDLRISEAGGILVDRTMVDTSTTLHLPDDVLDISLSMERLGTSIRLSDANVRHS